ncbi:hypothetical protein GcC1_049026b [Golovinomyces cichoracearum]|uniref:Uncharacterized protein n=1 Tax=Golovinomyces cichoracearum TaxID=62708 RepID=A0A420IX82_9PEZI|nr:hypothetical protein GcC1_049026b [Golovinomyces cichoracearum]
MLSPEDYNGHNYGMILTDEATSERWGYTFKSPEEIYGSDIEDAEGSRSPDQRCDPIIENENQEQDHDQSQRNNEISENLISPNNARNDSQIEEPEPSPRPRRYFTRGVKAKPSKKKAENEAIIGNNSKYGAYPAAFTACYLAGAKVSMDPQ